VSAQPRRHQHADRRGDEHRAGVPAQELPRAVSQGVGPGIERLAGEVVIEVTDQRLHRRVAPERIALHRGEAENVEVGPGRPARLHRPSRDLRRARRFLLQHPARSLVR